MAYEVLARKWRPRTFSEVVGQQHVLQVLAKAFESERLHHAYLFTGTRGVGKTTLARIVAKCLNCVEGVSAEPCGVCEFCRGIDEGNFPDMLEVDAASRTRVEEMRELLSDSSYAPTRGRFKVYLIDEVHMLSTHSFNALLKTLEEPPAHIKFLFATTDPQKLPATILSRCLQFHLKHLNTSEIHAQLAKILEQEQLAFESEAVMQLARAADGSMRDGLSLLDQAINYCADGLTQAETGRMLGLLPQESFGALVQALAGREPEAVMQAVAGLREVSPSFQDILDRLAGMFHACAMAAEGVGAPPPEGMEEWVDAINRAYSTADLQLGYQILLQGKRDLQHAPDEQTGLEMTLLRLLCFVPADWEGAPAPVAKPAPAPAPKAAEEVAPRPAEEAAAEPPQAPAAWKEGLDWEALTGQLDIRGNARVLASHCSVERLEGDTLDLTCDQGYAVDAASKDRLQAALGKHFARDIELRISAGVPQQETAAQKSERVREEQVQEAQREGETAPVLLALQEKMDARQVESRMHDAAPDAAES